MKIFILATMLAFIACHREPNVSVPVFSDSFRLTDEKSIDWWRREIRNMAGDFDLELKENNAEMLKKINDGNPTVSLWLLKNGEVVISATSVRQGGMLTILFFSNAFSDAEDLSKFRDKFYGYLNLNPQSQSKDQS